MGEFFKNVLSDKNSTVAYLMRTIPIIAVTGVLIWINYLTTMAIIEKLDQKMDIAITKVEALNQSLLLTIKSNENQGPQLQKRIEDLQFELRMRTDPAYKTSREQVSEPLDFSKPRKKR